MRLKPLAFLALLSVWMAIPAGCAHLQSGEAVAKRCAASAVANAVAGIGTDVATTLACDAANVETLPTCVEQGLEAVGGRAGLDALWCAVDAYANPTGDAKAALTLDELLRQRRARAWQAAHDGAPVCRTGPAPSGAT